MGVEPPHSSGMRSASLSCVLARSGLAPSLSTCGPSHVGLGNKHRCSPPPVSLQSSIVSVSARKQPGKGPACHCAVPVVSVPAENKTGKGPPSL